MKRLGGETLAHAQNIARGMPPLLYGDSSKAGERIAFFIDESSEVPDDHNFRVTGNAQVG